MQTRLDTIRTEGKLGTIGYFFRGSFVFPDGRGASQYITFDQTEDRTNDNKVSGTGSSANIPQTLFYTTKQGKVYLFTSDSPAVLAILNDK